MLYAIQPFFGYGKDDLAILYQRRRRVAMKHVKTEYQHPFVLL
jgi:hypothetical protein